MISRRPEAILVLLAVNVGLLAAQTGSSAFSVDNRTESLQVLSTELTGGRAVITVLNTSDRLITALAVSTAPGSYESEDWGFLEGDGATDGIEPGAQYEFAFSGRTQHSSAPLSVTLSAVIFDDQSAEGEKLPVEALLAKRLGASLQAERLGIPVEEALTALSDNPSNQDEAALDRLIDTARELRSRAADGSDPLLNNPQVSGGRSARHLRYINSAHLRGPMASGMSIAAEDVEHRVGYLKTLLPSPGAVDETEGYERIRQGLKKIRDNYRRASRMEKLQ